MECVVCHSEGPPVSLDGPHGMHPVNSAQWIDSHDEFYERSPNKCKACHGLNGQGTLLSRSPVKRVISTGEGGRFTIAADSQVSCGQCHANPISGGGGGD
jgi:hypothetical protein